jgi:cysteine synthase B
VAHYATTGPEIWRQTAGGVTHFVAGMGTSGTMMGVGRYLHEQDRAVQLVGAQPDRPDNGTKGLKYLKASDVPSICDPGGVDQILKVTTEEAETMARQLARREGLFVGGAAGAAVVAAVRVAGELAEGVVVAILLDGGFKYTGAPFWTE